MAGSDEQYDALGEMYERTKYIPTGLCERATLLSALPALRGRSVLDVACGTGFYPRQFSDLGAARGVGVDSSQEMISYARVQEEREPRGISYHQHDALGLPVLGSFDVVTAIWLLGYAADETALDQMITNLCANLAQDGTLAVLIPNPDADWDLLTAYGRYGYYVSRTALRDAGGRQPVVVHVLGDPPFDFDSFFWPPGIVEAALTRAGLADITGHRTVVPDNQHSDGFWAALRESPSFAVLTAHRGTSGG